MQALLRNRVAYLVLGVGLFAALVAARLVDLQIVKADALRARAIRQQQQVVEIGGRRGVITDRKLRELAVSITTRSFYAHPQRVKDPARAARLLAPVLGIAERQIREKLESDAPFVWIQRQLEPQTAKAVESLDLPIGAGKPFGFQDEPKRFYPHGSLATHAVGVADRDQKGIEGIEKSLDEVLRGDDSKYLAIVDAKREISVLQPLRPASKRSRDVVLTLDLLLQHVLEREIEQAMKETGARAASAILLDPTTGQVLALSNRPTADPRDGSKSAVEARKNRVVTDLYEPGSTFKAITASAALDQGRVSPETRFDCSPTVFSGKLYKDTHTHGVLSVREILEESSNIGIMRVGHTMTRESFRDYIVRFGFGKKTGIELPGERNGDITSLANMSDKSPQSMAMGYEIQVSVIQVAAAMGTIANGGWLVPPRIVLGTRGEDGIFVPSEQPEPRQVISPQAAAMMQDMLQGVVLRGTGKRSAVPGYRIAGKTGTAKKVRNGLYSATEYYSSFVGFGPLESPRLVAMVMLDTPSGGAYYGGVVAAPVVGRILADALTYLRVSPDDDPWRTRDEERKKREIAEAKTKAKSKRKDRPGKPEAGPEEETEIVHVGPGQVPDLLGKSLRDAAVALAEMGCRVRAQGTGVVKEQMPAPGNALPSDGVCGLVLGAAETPAEQAAPAIASLLPVEPRETPSRPSRRRR